MCLTIATRGMLHTPEQFNILCISILSLHLLDLKPYIGHSCISSKYAEVCKERSGPCLSLSCKSGNRQKTGAVLQRGNSAALCSRSHLPVAKSACGKHLGTSSGRVTNPVPQPDVSASGGSGGSAAVTSAGPLCAPAGRLNCRCKVSRITLAADLPPKPLPFAAAVTLSHRDAAGRLASGSSRYQTLCRTAG